MSSPLSHDIEARIEYMPPTFPMTTEGAIRYLPVTKDGITVGYLWASVDDDAAKYVPRPAAGDVAYNVGVAWMRRLRQAKAEGLTPLQALRHWVDAPEDPEAGAVTTETREREAASLQDLKDLAQS